MLRVMNTTLTDPNTGEIVLLRQDGIDLRFTADAAGVIADAAIKQGTGARGLRLVMEKVMRDIMFDAPRDAQENHTTRLTLNAEKISRLLWKDFRSAE